MRFHPLHSLASRVASPAVLLAAACGPLSACSVGDLPLPHDKASTQQVEQGRRLLVQYQCGSCHVVPGAAIARGQAGPSLEGFGRRSYIAGHVPNDPAALARWIEAPAALVPGTPMPSMGVSPADARAIAAYLLALK